MFSDVQSRCSMSSSSDDDLPPIYSPSLSPPTPPTTTRFETVARRDPPIANGLPTICVPSCASDITLVAQRLSDYPFYLFERGTILDVEALEDIKTDCVLMGGICNLTH